MRDAIARAIYEEPGVKTPWDEVSPDRRKGWLDDADRVILALEALPKAGRSVEAKGGASVAKPPNKPSSKCWLGRADCPGNCGDYGCGN